MTSRSLHRYEAAVLSALKKSKGLSLEQLISSTRLGRDEVLWSIESLAKDGLVEAERLRGREVRVTPEGEAYAKGSLPEMTLVQKLSPARSIDVKLLKNKEEQIGLMWAKNKGLVEISRGQVKITKKGEEAARGKLSADAVLKEIASDSKAYEKYVGTDEAAELQRRRLIEVSAKEAIGMVKATPKGAEFSIRETGQEIEQLDRGMIATGSWKGKKFKPYNVGVRVEATEVAIRHPLRRLIEEVRQAYLSMGFTEVSGPVVDTSFWVFDYLFVPQHHPARDVQDTFFLSRPKTLPLHDKALVKRVKKEHEKAWHGEWSEEVAKQAIPRTHMTSVTGRYMNGIINMVKKNPKSVELPLKIFTIGRCFRNENVDYKHLADFYQMDGIVIGKQLTLAHLFDVLIRLYAQLGIKLKFRPAYFPFVEPGVECYTTFKGKDLELFGAGVIRREITGIERKSISVLAWGPGVERIALLRNMGIENIASMYNTGIGWLRSIRSV